MSGKQFFAVNFLIVVFVLFNLGLILQGNRANPLLTGGSMSDYTSGERIEGYDRTYDSR